MENNKRYDIPEKMLPNGFSMPVLGIGTWTMGGKYEADKSNDEQELKVLRAALEMGVRHIDTAEYYGAGHAEELVGEAVKGFDRSKLLIVSKVWIDNLAYDDVLRACEGSLKRLGLDFIDLYLIHGPNPKFPIKDTIRALNKLRSQGMIKHIGVSNYNVSRMEEAKRYAESPIVNNQVRYSLPYRECEHKGVLSYCQENQVLLNAWRPLEKGALSEKPVPLVKELCEKYQKTPAQIALNWLFQQTNVVAIVKTTSIKHLAENLEALTWAMEDKDVLRLQKEYPGQVKESEIMPLDP